MLRKRILAIALVSVVGVGSAIGQPDAPPSRSPTLPKGYGVPVSRSPHSLDDPKPKYKYELTREHGAYLVVVKTFQGSVAGDDRGNAKELAEGLAEYIRAECRLYAYVHESGWAKRQQRDKEKAAVIQAATKYYREQGETDEQIKDRLKHLIKLARIPDEYSVLVAPGKGTLKDLNEALEFAKYVRTLKAPPAKFCDAVVVGSSQDVARTRGTPQNPFLIAMPGRNPTLPKPEIGMQRPKADDFLMSLNAGKPYSLIHKTKKDFTLVVKVYGTQFGQLQKPGEAAIANDRAADGELLERAAQQAQLIAEVLRKQDPPYEAYVLHTRYESFICVGEYDSKDDPKLLELSRRLAGLALTDKKGQTIETFMEKPLPAMIPRP